MNSPGASARQAPFASGTPPPMRRSLASSDAGQRGLGEAVGVAEVLARVGQQLGGLLVRHGDRAGMLGVVAQAPELARQGALVERVDGGQHVQPARRRSSGSQRSGSLGPASPSVAARATMPPRNSREKLAMTASGRPSARTPSAVTAMLSADSGLPAVHGSAVVTRGSRRLSHARPASASSMRKKTYAVCT